LYVVDTDVLSSLAPTKRRNDDLVGWLDRNSGHLYLSTVTIAEASYGLAWVTHRRATRKAASLRAWLDDVLTFYEDRVIAIDGRIGWRAGELRARSKANGFDVGMEDALVAASAELLGFTVLTRNARHFRPLGVRHVNPFEALPPE
jgi:hypothetical protein